MPHQVEEIPFVGLMDMDTPFEVFQKGIISDGRNITFRGITGNKRVENLPGTTLIPNAFLPTVGQNKNIGAFYDDKNHRIIQFNYNASGTHGIYILDTQTMVFQILCQISGNTDGDILGFDPDVYITSVDIIYGDGAAGDVLYFVDSLQRPTALNIQRYLAGTYPLITRSYIDVAKAPAQMPPKCVYENDALVGFNNVAKSLFQFRYRFVFDDYQKSVWGSPGITPLPNELSISTGVTDPTKNARIAVYVSTGDITVKKIELAVRITSEGATSDWQLLDSLDKELLTIADNDIYRYLFFNNETLIPLDVKEVVQFFDLVPQKANCQALLNVSTIAYGGITEGYDIVPSNQNIIDAVNGNSTTSLNSLTPGGQRVYGNQDIQFSNVVFTSGFVPNVDGSIFTYTGPAITGRVSVRLNGTIIATVLGVSEGNITLTRNGGVIVEQVNFPISTNAFTPFSLAMDYGNTTINTGDTFKVGMFIDYGDSVDVSIGGSIVITQVVYDTEVYADANGLLFFGAIAGVDSGTIGNNITFYFTGTGSNDGLGNPATFDSKYINGPTISYMAINVSSGGVDLSTVATMAPLVSDCIFNVSSALIAKGFTQVSQGTNTLVMSYPAPVILLSTGIKINYPAIDGTVPFLAYLNRSSEYFGVEYFDEKGRTNGVVTNASMKVTFPADPFSSKFSVAPSWAQIQVNHRPPLWAKYWQPVRSNNNISKLLYWVSDSALIDGNLITDQSYAYIGIKNIFDYNLSIQATSGVATYAFAPGDRISIYGKFNSQGVSFDFAPKLYDYEVLGVSVDPVINGIAKIGSFVKIKYPTADISSDLQFDKNNIDCQWYKIILYGITSSTAATQTSFFEFGKCFGIGNAGTGNAYHIGLDQTQSPDLVTPAVVSIINGDVFFRQRDVISSTPYDRPTNDNGYSSRYNCPTVATNTTEVVTANYIIGYQTGAASAGLDFASGPSYNLPSFDSGLFKNLSATKSYKIKIKGVMPAFTDGGTTSIDVYIKVVTASTAQAILITSPENLINLAAYTINLDATITVPPLSKAYIVTGNTMGVTNIKIPSFLLNVSVITDFVIPVFDQSYSDVHDEKTNSNGRPSVIDVNAKQTYYETLFRFSEPYQLGTAINNTNRFYFNNSDEFDKVYGPIIRMKLHDKDLRIFQYRKCGMVGIYAKFIKDQSGTNQLVTSDTIITPNNIQYYAGDFGIGNQPTALATSSFVDYFPDPVKGYLCRLSGDGIQPISELYKAQIWSGKNLPPYLAAQNAYQYGGTAKILGSFFFRPDKEGEYICSLQSGIFNGVTIGGESLVFNEKENGFTNKCDFAPDFVLCAENKLYSWSGGFAYIHDNITAYNTFYGQYFDSEVEFISKEAGAVKKEPMSISYNSAYPQFGVTVPIWLANQMGDIMSSLGQQSTLVIDDFYFNEGMYHADFKRDNSGGHGVVDGDFLKGEWFKIRLRNNSASFTFLSSLYLNYIISQRNG